MDISELLIGARVKWVSDRIKIAEIQPRHIGRVVSFTYFSEGGDESVMGILNGYVGSSITVNGEDFDYGQMADLRVFRSELA